MFVYLCSQGVKTIDFKRIVIPIIDLIRVLCECAEIRAKCLPKIIF